MIESLPPKLRDYIQYRSASNYLKHMQEVVDWKENNPSVLEVFSRNSLRKRKLSGTGTRSAKKPRRENEASTKTPGVKTPIKKTPPAKVKKQAK